MEIAIAIGLGLWFVITGTVSTFAVCRTFKKENSEDEKK